MSGASAVAQGRKGTGDDKQAIGLRCPPDIYAWLSESRLLRETDTGMVLRALDKLMALERACGERLSELQATAVLENASFGEMVAKLALEGLDARSLKKKR